RRRADPAVDQQHGVGHHVPVRAGGGPDAGRRERRPHVRGAEERDGHGPPHVGRHLDGHLDHARPDLHANGDVLDGKGALMRRIVCSLLLLSVAGPAALAAAPLRDSASARGFYIGAAAAMGPPRDGPGYAEALRREFNMVVAENAFKWDALRPSQTTYNFTDADAFMSFAETNSMAVRGHVLVWHNHLPGWLTGGNFTRDQTIAILRDHIMTVVGRYRGRILAWDVVNEA